MEPSQETTESRKQFTAAIVVIRIFIHNHYLIDDKHHNDNQIEFVLYILYRFITKSIFLIYAFVEH